MHLVFEANGRFEMNPMMLQMLKAAGQSSGALGEDPQAHLKSFMEICNTFSILRITPDRIRLSLFSFSLRDEAQ